MAVSYSPHDLVIIQSWPHVACVWYDCPEHTLHVKVAVGESDRTLTFDLALRELHPSSLFQKDYPGNLRHWVAFEVVRTAAALQDVETVRRRLTS